jgi:hypothetical protein
LMQIIIAWRQFKFTSSSKGRYSQKCKYREDSIKNFVLKIQWSRKVQIYMKASWHTVKSIMVLGGREGPQQYGELILCVFLWEYIFFWITTEPENFEFT